MRMDFKIGTQIVLEVLILQMTMWIILLMYLVIISLSVLNAKLDSTMKILLEISSRNHSATNSYGQTLNTMLNAVVG